MVKTQVHIDWMLRAHLEQVLRIERRAYGKYRWSEDDFIRVNRSMNNVPMVAMLDDDVVGYMIYERAKTRLQLLRIAVDHQRFRQGIGQQLMRRLLGKLEQRKELRNIVLEVRESNLNAQLFFKSMGFVWFETIKAEDEDIYRMQRRKS